MIKKLKPIQAKAVIEARQPMGIFYAYEDGVYVGIDNSTGHAWTEEFSSLRKCKEWLRNPSMAVQPSEWEENVIDRIARPEELIEAAMKQGIVIDTHEADMLLGYLEGHGYCLMADDEGRTARHDEQEEYDYSKDVPYSIWDAVLFCQEKNEELLQENESRCNPDAAYLCRLRKDEQALGALMEKISAAPAPFMMADSCMESRGSAAA